MMGENNSSAVAPRKKLLENSIFSGIAVPVAIVLVGALIVFGVTKMLSTERDYKDLVQEMKSKTFGNRWVAAYELSKIMATSKIPVEEIPVLVTELEEIYNQTNDPRTQEFIVAALSSMNHPLALPTFKNALAHSSSNVRFHAVVALGNYPLKKFPESLNLYPKSELIKSLETDDVVLKQAVILALAGQQFEESRSVILPFLKDINSSIRFAAATGLIYYQESAALPIIKEIFELKAEKPVLYNEQQIIDLQLNILRAAEKWPWPELNKALVDLAQKSSNKIIKTKAQGLLNQLKL